MCVDATVAGNMAHLLNHSCAPCCHSRTITVADPASGRRRDHVVIFASRWWGLGAWGGGGGVGGWGGGARGGGRWRGCEGFEGAWGVDVARPAGGARQGGRRGSELEAGARRRRSAAAATPGLPSQTTHNPPPTPTHPPRDVAVGEELTYDYRFAGEGGGRGFAGGWVGREGGARAGWREGQ
jgi:hypothetical protein